MKRTSSVTWVDGATVVVSIGSSSKRFAISRALAAAVGLLALPVSTTRPFAVSARTPVSPSAVLIWPASGPTSMSSIPTSSLASL